MGGGGFKKITWFSEGTGAPKQKFNTNQSETIKFNFLLKRIPAAAVPVSTMAHVKLVTLVKDFVVNVQLDSLAHFAKKVNQKKKKK